MTLFRKAVGFLTGRGALGFVIACSIAMLAMLVLVEANAEDIGQFKYTVSGDGTVLHAPAHSELRAGDRIDFDAMTPEQRIKWQYPKDGDRMRIPILRHGSRGDAEVEAQRFDINEQGGILRLIGVGIGFVVSMALATIVFLLRRRGATLAFYVYVMLMLLKNVQTPLNATPWPWNFIFNEVTQLVYVGTQCMIALFAFRIFNVRGRAMRAFLWAIGALGFVAIIAWGDGVVVATYNNFSLPGQMRYWENTVDIFFLGTTLAAVFYAAVHADVSNRRRVAWVVLGMALPLLNDFAWAVFDFCDAITNGAHPLLSTLANGTDLLQAWLGPIGAVVVCYGLVSNRVIDFRYALEVTALNAVASLVLLTVFTVLEMVLEHLIGGMRSAEYVTAISLILSGLSMKFIHEKTEAFAERVLFRKHHATLHHLRNAAARMQDAETAQEALAAVLDEARTTLALSYAAYVPYRGNDFAAAAFFGSVPADIEAMIEGALTRSQLPDVPMPLVHGKPASGYVIRPRSGGSVAGTFVYGPTLGEHALGKDELETLRDLAQRTIYRLNEITVVKFQERISVLESRLAAT